MNDLATTARPRPALTVLVLQTVDEEGHPGVVGTSHVWESTHPYRFVSRQAAAAIGSLLCDRCGCDGFRLHTPGYEPPPSPEIGESDIPF